MILVAILVATLALRWRRQDRQHAAEIEVRRRADEAWGRAVAGFVRSIGVGAPVRPQERPRRATRAHGR